MKTWKNVGNKEMWKQLKNQFQKQMLETKKCEHNLKINFKNKCWKKNIDKQIEKSISKINVGKEILRNIFKNQFQK